MKTRLNEVAVSSIARNILETFGAPLIGLQTIHEAAKNMCPKCGLMSEAIERINCQHCSYMFETLDSNEPEVITAVTDTVKDKQDDQVTQPAAQSGAKPAQKSSSLGSQNLNEKTPPGREKQVRALKKDKNIDNPWAVAWASVNKKK